MLSILFAFAAGMWFGWRLPVGIKAYKDSLAQAVPTETPRTQPQAALAGLKAMFGL